MVAPLSIGNTVTVEGNCAALASTGYANHFRVVAPPCVNGFEGGRVYDPVCEESRYLWAGYRYEWPIVGHRIINTSQPDYNQPGPDGSQTTWDGNALGQYHCWNREYDVLMGRWTTPDNVPTVLTYFQYVGSRVTSHNDPSGLEEVLELDPVKSGAQDGAWKQVLPIAVPKGDSPSTIGPAILYHSAETNGPGVKSGTGLRGAKIRQGVHNIWDLIHALRKMVSDNKTGETCKCIGNLSIVAHGGRGGKGGFRMGDDSNKDGKITTNEAFDFVSGNDEGKLFGEKIKGAMCSNCVINIMGCRSGSKYSEDTLLEIAKATGCRVRGSVTNVQHSWSATGSTWTVKGGRKVQQVAGRQKAGRKV